MTGKDDWESNVVAPARRRRRRSQADATRRLRERRIKAAAILTGSLFLLLAVAGVFGARHSSNKPSLSPAQLRAARQRRARGEAAGEAAAINSTLAYTQFVRQGSARKREVALTFDDGPGPYTPAILRTLRRAHAKATFFEVGVMLQSFRRLATKEVRDRFAIGDHTFDHPHMAGLSADLQRSELMSQSAELQGSGAPAPRLFRPPYGSFNPDTLALLSREHMLMVLWSVDTQDYAKPGTQAIVDRALSGARPGAIILMHDAGGDRSETVAALPAILRGLHRRHLKPVTIPKLLLDDPPPPGQPIPWGLAGGG